MFARLKERRNRDGREVVYVQVVHTVRPRKMQADWLGRERSVPDREAPARQRIIATLGRVERLHPVKRSELVRELSKLLGMVTPTKERRKDAKRKEEPEAAAKA